MPDRCYADYAWGISNMKRQHRSFLGVGILLLLCAFVVFIVWRTKYPNTVSSRVSQFGAVVKDRLIADFTRTGISYPPKALTIIAIKDKKELQVYASNKDQNFKLIRTYPILAASGNLGPKLKEGDRQVPEGIYKPESLNPNSLYHLAIRVNYPNSYDKQIANEQGRDNLGSDIMIHGSNQSIGCLAMGDQAVEDLFILAALTGIDNTNLIFTPIDFRTGDTSGIPAGLPNWTKDLYNNIADSLKKYKDR